MFGCICYVLVPAPKRHKLEEKSQKGVFLGYSTQSKGYRVYILETEKLIISRDVQFDEGAFWDWKESKISRKSALVPITNSEPATDHDIQIEEPETPVSTPISASSESSTDSPPRRLRSLNDIYESCNFLSLEPENYAAASKEEVWVKAMEEEMRMIKKNDTWVLVDLPAEKEAIGVKWIYKTKLNPDKSVQKHKARLVVKGYAQQLGGDYNETVTPVARLDTIRALIALVAKKKWKIFQLDVKSAFLNGELQEEVYVKKPEGFIEEPGKVLRLKKALYGLKQAPRAWYGNIGVIS